MHADPDRSTQPRRSAGQPTGAANPTTMSRLIGVATALMCALASGAVWCVLALQLRADLIVLVIPVAVLIAWVLRTHGFARSGFGAALAAACVVLCFVYSAYLLAAAKVAAYLGLPLRSSLLMIGPEMAAAVAWADLTPWHVATVVVASVLAAWLVVRRGRSPGVR